MALRNEDGLLPTTRSRRGRYAVIADPQGAAFAVFGGEPTHEGRTDERGRAVERKLAG